MIAALTTPSGFPWVKWPHRVAALVAASICIQAWLLHRLGDPAATLLLNVLPFMMLEAVARLPETPLARGIFLSGSLCIAATLVFYAPYFSRGSGEWARLNFLFIPGLQLAGVIVLAAVLGAFRLLKW